MPPNEQFLRSESSTSEETPLPQQLDVIWPCGSGCDKDPERRWRWTCTCNHSRAYVMCIIALE